MKEEKDDKQTQVLRTREWENATRTPKKKKWKTQKKTGGGGAEAVEHAGPHPTTLEMLLRKWQRYCV